MLLGELRRWGMPATTSSSGCCPTPTGRSTGSRTSATATATATSSTPASPRAGLANQGWKDSWDAIRFADGAWPRRRSRCARCRATSTPRTWPGPTSPRRRATTDTLRHWRARARDLRQRFNEDFWLDDHGTYALGARRGQAADRRGRLEPGPLPVDRHRRAGAAALVADAWWHPTCSPAGGSARWPPAWPRTTRSATTTARCGRTTTPSSRPGSCATASSSTPTGSSRASSRRPPHFERLPELFAGFSRTEVGIPASYPTSCSPQAWAAGSPLLWLRTLLRLDPCVPGGRVWVAPVLPPSIRRLSVEGIALGPHRLDVAVDRDHVDIRAPDAVQVTAAPRPPESPHLGPGPASP